MAEDDNAEEKDKDTKVGFGENQVHEIEAENSIKGKTRIKHRDQKKWTASGNEFANQEAEQIGIKAEGVAADILAGKASAPNEGTLSRETLQNAESFLETADIKDLPDKLKEVMPDDPEDRAVSITKDQEGGYIADIGGFTKINFAASEIEGFLSKAAKTLSAETTPAEPAQPASAEAATAGKAAPPSYAEATAGKAAPPSYAEATAGKAAPPSYAEATAGKAAPPSYAEATAGKAAPPSYAEATAGKAAPPSYAEATAGKAEPPSYAQATAQTPQTPTATGPTTPTPQSGATNPTAPQGGQANQMAGMASALGGLANQGGSTPAPQGGQTNQMAGMASALGGLANQGGSTPAPQGGQTNQMAGMASALGGMAGGQQQGQGNNMGGLAQGLSGMANQGGQGGGLAQNLSGMTGEGGAAGGLTEGVGTDIAPEGVGVATLKEGTQAFYDVNKLVNKTMELNNAIKARGLDPDDQNSKQQLANDPAIAQLMQEQNQLRANAIKSVGKTGIKGAAEGIGAALGEESGTVGTITNQVLNVSDQVGVTDQVVGAVNDEYGPMVDQMVTNQLAQMKSDLPPEAQHGLDATAAGAVAVKSAASNDIGGSIQYGAEAADSGMQLASGQGPAYAQEPAPVAANPTTPEAAAPTTATPTAPTTTPEVAAPTTATPTAPTTTPEVAAPTTATPTAPTATTPEVTAPTATEVTAPTATAPEAAAPTATTATPTTPEVTAPTAVATTAAATAAQATPEAVNAEPTAQGPAVEAPTSGTSAAEVSEPQAAEAVPNIKPFIKASIGDEATKKEARESMEKTLKETNENMPENAGEAMAYVMMQLFSAGINGLFAVIGPKIESNIKEHLQATLPSFLSPIIGKPEAKAEGKLEATTPILTATAQLPGLDVSAKSAPTQPEAKAETALEATTPVLAATAQLPGLDVAANLGETVALSAESTGPEVSLSTTTPTTSASFEIPADDELEPLFSATAAIPALAVTLGKAEEEVVAFEEGDLDGTPDSPSGDLDGAPDEPEPANEEFTVDPEQPNTLNLEFLGKLSLLTGTLEEGAEKPLEIDSALTAGGATVTTSSDTQMEAAAKASLKSPAKPEPAQVEADPDAKQKQKAGSSHK